MGKKEGGKCVTEHFYNKKKKKQQTKRKTLVGIITIITIKIDRKRKGER